MRVLITGSNGQLGRAVKNWYQQQKENNQLDLILTGHSTKENKHKSLDITDEQAVMDFVLQHTPDIIINCAAYTAVDRCEEEEALAYLINCSGVKYLAQAAEKIKAKLIHISTDYVFDGKKEKPYQEDDLACPINAYGRTKLAGEEFAKIYCSRTFILRTAWVYGDGKNFVTTMLRLAEQEQEITVVDDQFGSPTSTTELAKAICFLAMSDNYGVYHAVCNGMTSWYQFAAEIFNLQKRKVKLVPISAKNYVAAAKRPSYSVLDNSKLNAAGCLMADWRDALMQYLNDLT